LERVRDRQRNQRGWIEGNEDLSSTGMVKGPHLQWMINKLFHVVVMVPAWKMSYQSAILEASPNSLNFNQ
jgi:hypothetical protein